MSNRGFGSSWREIRRLFDGGSVAGLGDGELLERFATRGDEAALRGLVARHGPLVLGVCRRILTDSAAAEDAFQATFLVLADRANSIRGRDHVAPWLHRVARNVALRSKRNLARREVVERNAAVAEADGDEIGIEVERAELRALIDGEIARLPRSQREPVILCYLEGLKHEEAAVELGLSVNQLRGRLDRARDRLQDRLTRRGLAPSGNALALLAAPGLSPGLMTTTCRAALTFGAGRVGAGLATASAVALYEGVLKTMMLSKLKFGLAFGFAALLTAVSVAVSQPRPVVTQDPPVTKQDSPPAAKKREGRRLIDVAGPPETGGRFVQKRKTDWQKPDLDAAPESVAVSISGVIRDLDDRPIAGATVYALGMAMLGAPRSTMTTTLVGKTTTAKDGSYTFANVDITTSRGRNISQRATPYVSYQVQARAPGYGFGWHSQGSMYAIDPPHLTDIQKRATLGTPVVMNVYLRPEADLKGWVLDEANKPVAGVKISLRDVNLMDERGIETAVSINMLPEDWPDGFGQTWTDADGRFKLSGLPSESCCWLFFERADSKGNRALYASTLAETKTDHGQPVPRNNRSPHEVYPRDMIVSMPSPRTIEVVVVADDDGKPVPNVQLRTLGDTLATGVWSGGISDAEGRVELNLPVGRHPGLFADPDSTGSRFIRTYRREPLDVTAEPKVQKLEFRMKPGFELLFEAVDPATGKGVPGICFEIKKSADDPWVLVEPSTFSSGPNGTDAEGKLRAVIPSGPGKSYQVRVVDGETRDPANPAKRRGLPEKLPYDVTPTISEAFEPSAGNWASFRFLLKKRDR